jgi:hypothetical protein
MTDRLARLTADMNELERALDLTRRELIHAVRGPGGSWDHPDAARLKAQVLELEEQWRKATVRVRGEKAVRYERHRQAAH